MQVHRIQNNTCDSTSFNAKLSLSLVKNSEKRWQGIADEFERITEKYPNSTYEFIPSGTFSKGLELHLSENCAWPSSYVKLKPKMTKLMAKMSDTEIANKLQKLFELWVESRTMSQQSENIADKLFYLNNEEFDIFAANYAYAVSTGLHNRANKELKKDDFFKKMIDAIEFPY